MRSSELRADHPIVPAEEIAARLARLRALPGILKSRQDRQALACPLISEWPEGLPCGAISEFVSAAGGGKTEAAIRILAENPGIRGAWIEPTLTVYPCAFPQLGVTLDRVLFTEPGDQALWAAHQILRSQLFGLVVLSVPEAPLAAAGARALQAKAVAAPFQSAQALTASNLNEIDLRRLQLSAEKSGAALLLLRERPTVRGNWAIAIQARVLRKGKELRIL
jgi:hypothetical protein